jgi:hypothetical protein
MRGLSVPCAVYMPRLAVNCELYVIIRVGG